MEENKNEHQTIYFNWEFLIFAMQLCLHLHFNLTVTLLICSLIYFYGASNYTYAFVLYKKKVKLFDEWEELCPCHDDNISPPQSASHRNFSLLCTITNINLSLVMYVSTKELIGGWDKRSCSFRHINHEWMIFECMFQLKDTHLY